jgi:hypothetical protein
MKIPKSERESETLTFIEDDGANGGRHEEGEQNIQQVIEPEVKIIN